MKSNSRLSWFIMIRSFRLLFCLLLLASPALSAWAAPLDFGIDKDPFIPEPQEVLEFDEDLVVVWEKAINQEGAENEIKIRGAHAVMQAKSLGMEGLERFVPTFVKLLESEDETPAVRLAAARALVTLDAKEQAEVLAAAARGGTLDMKVIVEPAIAAWQLSLLDEVWLNRLKEPPKRPDTLMAIHGLSATQSAAAMQPLEDLVKSADTPFDIRLAAARALSAYEKLDVVKLAKEVNGLKTRQSIYQWQNPYLAAVLLQQQDSAEATAFLVELLEEKSVVAAAALDRLVAVAPDAVAPQNEALTKSADARVRSLMVEVMRKQATPEVIELLRSRLDDPVPSVRQEAAAALTDLHQNEALTAAVEAAVEKSLNSKSANELEQAAITAAGIDLERVADRLVDLLEHESDPVSLAASWGLGRLQVEETGPPIVKLLRSEMNKSNALQEKINAAWPAEAKDPLQTRLNHMRARATYLIEAIGLIGDESNVGILRDYLPKPKILAPTDPPRVTFKDELRLRMAANWALGQIYKDRPDNPVAARLLEQLDDEDLLVGEMTEVRGQAAIALGRMNAEDKLERLRYWLDKPDDYSLVGWASAWAVREVAGDEIPDLKPIKVRKRGWFLEPSK